ncbi:diacylglycerol acyltransferase-domain-containing protein [Nemania sp. FL0031]|nr:diacylglycerol acyltransferase-domain-containing protein [Nemania sp. FL0031]
MAEETSVAEPKHSKTNGASPRYFYLVSRKNSQSGITGPETGKASDRGTRLGKDTIRSHQRDSSITSQESHEPSIPDTPSRRSKTGSITPSTDISFTEPPSQNPRGSGIRGSSPRPPFRRNCSLRTPADSDMANPAGNKPIPTNIASKQPGRQMADSQPAPERTWPREDSYVNIDEMSTPVVDKRDPPDDEPLPQVNGFTEKSHTGSSDGQAHGDVTYTSIPDSNLHDDDSLEHHDDDDSYPELDDMGMEEVHRPPPRKPNGGIRWAPWNVPFRRRGQTLVVLMHSLSIVATVSLFFAFCANPFAWPLLLIYLLHVLSSKAATDGTLKYRSEWLRKSYIWHFFADYYPARLHKTHDLPETRKYIFGYHPHGIISHGAWAAFATDALGFSKKFPGITNSLLTLDNNFRIPFYREYILSMGVRSVSKESIVNILCKGGSNGEGMGRGVTVVVGGARESLEAQPGMMRLILSERKGFIKLAVRCGADLVPVLAFGENDLYDQLQPQEHPFMHQIQMFILKVWKFTLPFLHGRGIFNYDVGLMPYRRPLNIVVGAPIKVRQSSSVNLEEINRLHGLYVAELEKLWDRYKDEFAPDRKEEMQILP